MLPIAREFVAYAIMGASALAAAPLIVMKMRQRHRDKLRRRGIKRYGH